MPDAYLIWNHYKLTKINNRVLKLKNSCRKFCRANKINGFELISGSPANDFSVRFREQGKELDAKKV